MQLSPNIHTYSLICSEQKIVLVEQLQQKIEKNIDWGDDEIN